MAGFTIRMIWALLGLPHRSDTHDPFPRKLTRHYYRASTLAEACNSKRFHILRVWDALIQVHELKHRDRDQHAITHWAKHVPITTNFPDIPLEKVIQLAIQDRKTWENTANYPWGTPEEAPEHVLHRWAYTYLKHNFTNYDHICSLTRAQPFGLHAYTHILHRVNVLILDRYPIRTRVHGDDGQRTKTCRRCGRKQEGTFNGHYWQPPEGWYSRSAKNTSSAFRLFCSRSCAAKTPR